MKWIIGLFGVAAALVLFMALTTQQSPARQPAQAVRYDHVLTCEDCEAIGQPAYVYSTLARDKLQCRAVWGARVAILSRHDDVLQVDVQDWCKGFVGASLVKPS